MYNLHSNATLKYDQAHIQGNELKIFGYNIYNQFLVNVSSSSIISLNEKNAAGTIILKNTMMRLLTFFLNIKEERLISADEILREVWDNYNLSSSSQRLWQVLQSLKKKLSQLGIPDEFIYRTETGGYRVKVEFVTPLYYYHRHLA